MTVYDPEGVALPLGHYSHVSDVPTGARWLVISGQVGIRPDGAIAEGIAEQSEWTWRNLLTCLQAAGMGVPDIVKVGHFLVHPADFPAYAEVRGRYLGDHKPASTLLYVQGLVKPELRVEVEVTAAKAD